MKCYVVCENKYRDDQLEDVNIIGVADTIDGAKKLVDENRAELKRLHPLHEADFFDDGGAHEFRTSYGEVFRTCIAETKRV